MFLLPSKQASSSREFPQKELFEYVLIWNTNDMAINQVSALINSVWTDGRHAR